MYIISAYRSSTPWRNRTLVTGPPPGGISDVSKGDWQSGCCSPFAFKTPLCSIDFHPNLGVLLEPVIPLAAPRRPSLSNHPSICHMDPNLKRVHNPIFHLIDATAIVAFLHSPPSIVVHDPPRCSPAPASFKNLSLVLVYRACLHLFEEDLYISFVVHPVC